MASPTQPAKPCASPSASAAVAALPYWQVNVPPAERTAECPAFLRHVNDKDRGILSTPDAAYQALSWAEVQAIVAANRLERFQRTPSELRRYLAYTWMLKERYGSVGGYLQEKLGWGAAGADGEKGGSEAGGEADGEDGADAQTAATPTERALLPPHVRILCNDWPYGLDPRIVHLVVWTKGTLEEGADGDLTAAARAAIDNYVAATFPVGPERCIWFKNWKSLKSVHQIEHFHVMLFDPPAALVDELTQGDVPMSQRLREGGRAKA